MLGCVPTLLAAALAVLAATRSRPEPGRVLPLRRLPSGHIGDDVARLLAGATLLGALTLPGRWAADALDGSSGPVGKESSIRRRTSPSPP